MNPQQATAMKHMNARLPIAAAALLLALGSTAQTNVAVNANGQGTALTPTALLDIDVSSLPAAGKKGLLIPRMTAAQRGVIVGPVQGLTVYQTDVPRGFYFYNGLAWTYLNPSGQTWTLTGNVGTTAADFVGSTSAQSIAIGTSGAERVRLDTQGDLGVGQVNPVEKLDVAGAIRLSGTSATSTAGTIRWNGAPNNYHEGNMVGTATGSPTGWRKLENDYVETFGAAYSQPSAVTCATGGSEIGPYTTHYSLGAPAPTSAALLVTPFLQQGNPFGRVRHQYLFRVNELNLELNQLFLNPLDSTGLCAGQPIDSIAFYVPANILAANQKPLQYSVVIKHTSLSAFAAAFDNTADPAQQCASSGASQPNQPTLGAGWKWYRFASPFVWDGVRNIIIDFSYASGTGTAAAIAVWSTSAMVTPYNCTYGAYGATASCSGTFSNSCTLSGACASGTFGPAQSRPVVRFNGIVGHGTVATTGTGKYINYNGGFIVEDAVGWGTGITPYKFKGPGKISAEKGVFDGQIRLNDHVFDRYFDGRVNPNDAAQFGSQRVYDVNEMVSYVERERHLPTMKGRDAWERESGFALGDLGNQLWTTMETHALYLTEMNDQTTVLRVLTNNDPIRPGELELVKNAVASMSNLNEQEKQALIRSCQLRTVSDEQAR